MGFLSQCVTAFNSMMLFRNSVPFSGPKHINPLWGENQKINNQFPLKRGIIVVVDYKLGLHSQRRGGRALDLRAMRRKSPLCSVLSMEAEALEWRLLLPRWHNLGQVIPLHGPISLHSQMDSRHSWAVRVHGVRAARTNTLYLRSHLIFIKPGEICDLLKVTKLRRREARIRTLVCMLSLWTIKKQNRSYYKYAVRTTMRKVF